ncbi:MAG: MarR family transcriptional regulator [Hydrogenophilaceae bacterium]|jgi:DNA-binding MarR family transcriptional regulator|nr:MarR family transcriptional regulator [Hydrogenophilaceae bacterium]
MAGLAERLEEFELRPSEASVLVVIGENSGITQSELGKMLGIVSANMAPLIARLEARDLVARKPVDGRSFGLSLTRAGARLAETAFAAMQEHERDLIARIPPASRAGFVEALQALLDELQD